MRKVQPTLPAAALAALVLAGCGGAGGAFSGHSGGAARPTVVGHSESRVADVVASGHAVREGSSGTESSAPARGAFTETAYPASADLRSGRVSATSAAQVQNAQSAAAARDRAPKARDGIPPSTARVSPSAPEVTTKGVAATGADASRRTPSATAAVHTETGGVGVWLLGLLIAAAVGGGGWLALQPEWVRARVLRSLKAAPGRLLTMLRLRRARETPITTTWSTPGSAWIASACEDKDAEGRAKGVDLRRRTTRHPMSITNATLPAMRIPVDQDSDSSTTDGD